MSRKNKKFRKAQIIKPEVLPKRAEQAAPINLGFLNAATIRPPDYRMVQIIQVGCGGIGAYMAQHIGRLMRVMYQSDKGVHLLLVDPDEVRYENIGRQLFCDAEVGRPKCEALARRYGHAWGLNVSSYVGEFEDSLLLGTELTVLVGCVDNAKARQSLHEVLQANDPETLPSIWWLDCGNLRDTGRVLLGTAKDIEQCAGAFIDKTCIALPGPGLQSPGLLEPTPEELAGTDMSCAQLAAANLQSLNINSLIAAVAADFLTRLLLTNDLKRFACEINLAAGAMKSIYAIPQEVARVIGRDEAFVMRERKGSPVTVAAAV